MVFIASGSSFEVAAFSPADFLFDTCGVLPKFYTSKFILLK